MNRPLVHTTEGDLRRRTRRAFLIGGAAAAAGIAGYEWMRSDNDSTGIPKLQRRALDFNGKLAQAYLRDTHRMPEYPRSRVEKLKPNGNIGLTDPVPDDWELNVITNAGPVLTLSLNDVKSLPQVDLVTRFCCIEGWSTITQWTGIRFADFTRKFLPPGHPPPPYVRMATPDEDYYVGLDMRSALHPQTLLAWELNGAALTPEHGAPLRLVIPVKYGIKNLKRIGAIEYTAKQPGDYWAEEGYDWFSGL
jgi:DMSO/TMAO reductase YedYZ molybdopterin-dependent catalytic subunit